MYEDCGLLITSTQSMDLTVCNAIYIMWVGFLIAKWLLDLDIVDQKLFKNKVNEQSNGNKKKL